MSQQHRQGALSAHRSDGKPVRQAIAIEDEADDLMTVADEFPNTTVGRQLNSSDNTVSNPRPAQGARFVPRAVRCAEQHNRAVSRRMTIGPHSRAVVWLILVAILGSQIMPVWAAHSELPARLPENPCPDQPASVDVTEPPCCDSPADSSSCTEHDAEFFCSYFCGALLQSALPHLTPAPSARPDEPTLGSSSLRLRPAHPPPKV